MAWQARWGKAGNGRVRHSVAGHGTAGVARQAWLVTAWSGTSEHGWFGEAGPTRLGVAGVASHPMARHGGVRQGRLGKVVRGQARRAS